MKTMKNPDACEFRNHHLGQAIQLELWRREYDDCRKKMSTTSREKMDDYIAKVKVFMQYGYFDKQMNIQSKGKVADEMLSTDKILTTELLYSGILNTLTNEECIALFTILVTQIRGNNKAVPCAGFISEAFN